MRSSEVFCYDFDEFRLEVEKQLLLKNGQPITLTHKAFQTLLILVQNSGQIVEKEDIFAKLWADSFVEEANLTQYVYVLRKALGRQQNGQQYIETAARRGYIFKAQVKSSLSSTRTAAAPLSTAENGMFRLQLRESNERDQTGEKSADASYSVQPKAARSTIKSNVSNSRGDEQPAPVSFHNQSEKHYFAARLLMLPLLAGMTLLAIILSAYFQNQQSDNPEKIKSLAILPFKPIDGESANDKLGLGMADAVITRLSKLQEIPVRPTSAIFGFADRADVNPWTAGRELNVDAVLEGSVQRDGETVRVSVRLIKVAGGKALWADNFDEKFTNIFALQDAISTKVARAVSLNLSGAQEHLLTQRATTDSAAYQAYSFGIYFGNKRTKDGLQKAVENFQKAIEIDPNYAEAYAELADSYNMLGHYNFADSGEMVEKGRAAAEKALALNNRLAEAHVAIAYVQVHDRRFVDATRSLELALALAPYNSTAHVRYGWQLLRMGKLPETVEQMRLAQEYDPLWPVGNNTLCTVLLFQHNFAEAVGYCEKAVELSPNAPSNRLSLANAYFFNGRVADAITQAKAEIEAGSEKDTARGSLAYFYAKSGRTAEAEEIFRQLKTVDEAEVLSDLMIISYTLGKKDESYAYFKKAYQKNLLPYPIFPFDPVWDEVRQDARFAEFFKSSGCPTVCA